MKVLINRDPIIGPWGGGARFLEVFHSMAKENGIEIVKTLEQSPDVIFIFHPDPEPLGIGGEMDIQKTWEGFQLPFSATLTRGISFWDALDYKRRNPDTKLIIRVNECDARKGTTGVDDKWITMGECADHTFFVSKWMQDYYLAKGWLGTSREVLVNGACKESFKRKKKISDSTGKTNIVCAHWSDNSLKGQDVYEYLDKFVSSHAEFTFTFIGRTKANLKHSFLISPMSPKELVEELSRYDVCINGSRFDPGPNAVIESIVAGLPTYVHSDGGGGVDFAGNDHTFSSFEELDKILLSKNYPMNPDIFRSWGDVMAKVFDRIKSL